MTASSILLDYIDGREAAALMANGRLEDVIIASQQPPPGTIYRATVERTVKGQGGVFMRTPDGPGFLRQVKGLAPGQAVLVQVTGYAEPGKAIPLTPKVLFKSRYCIITPGAPGRNVSRSIKQDDVRDRLLEVADSVLGDGNEGLILRSSCARAEDDAIADDIEAMSKLALEVLADKSSRPAVLVEGDGPHTLAWRDWGEPDEVLSGQGSFEQTGVLDALDKALLAREALENDGLMFIEPTRALVAVDVNTGRDVSLAAGLKANLSCAKSLPRALRLRGLGGQVVLDLAPMQKRERRLFETALKQAFRRDDIETAFVGWTPMGHFELQRKRARVPLSEVYP